MSYIPKIPVEYSYKFLSIIEHEVLHFVNYERGKVCISPIILSEDLGEIARYKSNEMLQYSYFAHRSIYTGYSYDLAKNFFNYHFKFFAENIQMGQGYDETQVTSEYLFNGWIKSKEHRMNILNTDYKKMGIGVVYSGNGRIFYSSQLFSD